MNNLYAFMYGTAFGSCLGVLVCVVMQGGSIPAILALVCIALINLVLFLKMGPK